MNNIEYINIVITTNNRYICESRDSRNRRITVTAESTDTIEGIMNKLEEELDPFERELNVLREEQSVMKEREIELTKNVAELTAANKNAARALAAKYVDGETQSIVWEDAVKESKLLKIGDVVSYDGTIYMVIFEHTARIDRPPYGTWTWFTDITKEVNEEVAGEGGIPEIVGPDTLHLYPQDYIGQKGGIVYKSKFPNNGNPVTNTGWWDNLGPVDEYQE